MDRLIERVVKAREGDGMPISKISRLVIMVASLLAGALSFTAAGVADDDPPPRVVSPSGISIEDLPSIPGYTGVIDPGDGIIDIGSRRELFVDRFLVDRLEGGARLVMHAPKDEGAVLKFDKPWEGAFCGYATVIPDMYHRGYTDSESDHTAYHLYYRGLPEAGKNGGSKEVTCYAVSLDGIHWTKPELGLFEVAGTRKNNVILADAAPVTHNFSPFLDRRPDVPPLERFKALGGNKTSGLRAYVSHDGVHWSPVGNEPVFTKGIFDSQNVAFWSEHEKCYVCYFRTWTGEGYRGFRTVSRTTSEDFKIWTEPAAMTFGDTPSEHLYTNQTHPYVFAPHIYLALAARFMPGRQVLTEADAKRYGVNPRYYKDCSDVVLLTSRGGNRYDRIFMESFIRPGPSLANWASRSNYPALNVVVTKTAEGGQSEELSIYVNRRYAQSDAELARYSLRVDGFASVRAPYAGGVLVTRPFRFRRTGPVRFGRDFLTVNYSTSAAGGIRIGLEEPDGTPIPGYSLVDADELIGDEIRGEVTWKGKRDVTSLSGRPIRMRIRLIDADLYAFQFDSYTTLHFK